MRDRRKIQYNILFAAAKLRRLAFCLVCLLTAALPAHSQKVAIRNNLLYDATLTPNLGIEFKVGSAWTLGVNAGLQAWDMDSRPEQNKKLRHLLIAPNLRRYLSKSDTLFRRGYIETDVIYSHYNISNFKFPLGLYPDVKDRRFQGDLLALGAKYGYGWMLARSWRLEAEAGVAVGYAWYKEYECPHCGNYLGEGNRIFLLPQLGINVVCIIN